MNIHLEVLTEEHGPQLYEFEVRNREYFETMVPSRGDAYYQYEVFLEQLQLLLMEQQTNQSIFFLIIDNVGNIIGRLNIIDIQKEQSRATLGYRIGQTFIGRGIATEAVKLSLKELAKYGVRTLYAKTTKENSASQRVLEKSGFIQMENKRYDEGSGNFLYYTWEQK